MRITHNNYQGNEILKQIKFLAVVRSNESVGFLSDFIETRKLSTFTNTYSRSVLSTKNKIKLLNECKGYDFSLFEKIMLSLAREFLC